MHKAGNKNKYVNSAVKKPADSFLKNAGTTSTTNDEQNHVRVSHLVLILAPMPIC